MSSLRCQALVASPFLSDPNFARTVVYLLQHSHEGAFGLVLNQPTGRTVAQRLKQIANQEIDCSLPLYCGGPVKGPLIMLHTFEDRENEIGIVTNWMEIAQLCDGNSENSHQYRVFEGYSGWAGGQLEYELEEGSWLIWRPKLAEVFMAPHEVWSYSLNQISRDAMSALIDQSSIPDDPMYN